MTDLKKALILGCHGMDGSHMVDHLIKLGYLVTGCSHRIQAHRDMGNPNFLFCQVDVRDTERIKEILDAFSPHEVYNFSGITFSPDADLQELQTMEINCHSIIRIARICAKKGIKFIQSSSSEVFGNVSDSILNEGSIRKSHSIYSRAKNEVDFEMQKLRESGHQMYTAILFPHESERRKEHFLIRKISLGVSKISEGSEHSIVLGSLDSSRDWSSARDFMNWMQLMAQGDPDTFVLASGKTHTVRDVLNLAFAEVGISDWTPYIIQNQELIRKIDRNNLAGDNTKIIEKTGFRPPTEFEDLIRSIVKHDRKKL
jgi:GDPmannose 4,6-dehydratase